MVEQYSISLASKKRGFHLITNELLSKVDNLPQTGVFHAFIQHTSAGLTINENADPSVRIDFESIFNRLVKENEPYYTHTLEGSDDMPAHVKSSIVGTSVSIPITNHQLNLGTWQGIYLCEFRDYGGSRNIILTIQS